MELFTVPEINLICIFDTSSKETILIDLKLCQKNIYEPEMIELVKTTIKKLEKITDEEFTEIGYFIADNFYDFYEE